jgi:Fibronectin type III domain/HYR domain
VCGVGGTRGTEVLTRKFLFTQRFSLRRASRSPAALQLPGKHAMAGHKLLIACVLTLAILGFGPPVDAASLTLAWDHSTSSNVAGYLVSYGTQAGKYTATVKAGYVTSVGINGLTEGTTYYFSVQSYDSAGTTGSPSPEVSGKVPAAVPVLSISCPSPVLTSPDGKPLSVTLTPKVSGGVAPVSTSCSPASGSLFSVGTTSFACTAVDAAQQKASCSSTVVVAAPSQPAPTQPAPAPAPAPQPAPAPAPQPAPAPAPQPAPAPAPQPAPAPAPQPAPAPAPQPAPAPAPKPAPKPTPPGHDPERERERDDKPTPPGQQPEPAPEPTPSWPEPGVAPEPTWPGPDPGVAPEPTPTLPPVGVVSLVCPAIAPVKEEAQSGKAVVQFADPIFSDGTVPVTVSCSPRSGSQFRIGTTTVACSATDAAYQLFSCTTTVTVTDRPKLSNGGGL